LVRQAEVTRNNQPSAGPTSPTQNPKRRSATSLEGRVNAAMSSSSAGLIARELDPEDPTNAIQDELYSSWALLILVTLLIATLWMSYYLQLKKIRAVHETVVSIFGGISLHLKSAYARDDCGVDYTRESGDDDPRHGLVQVLDILQLPSAAYYSQFWI
jgi:sodium/hydrogen exchanger-like protein 6/7